MDFQLFVVRGRSASEALKLADGVTTVGRQDDCLLRIKSSQVSRRHCELFEKKGLLLVKDLGSANGTFVNGKKVDGQQVLEPGDELTIGPVKLRVGKVGQAAPQPTGAPAAVPAGDTAIVEAIALTDDSATADEEFEIDFDDEPAPAAAPAAAAQAAPAKPAAPEPKTAPEPEPAPAAADAADEAIADFLLDIKIDDED